MSLRQSLFLLVRLPLLFSSLDVCLVCFLALPDEVSQDADLVIVVLIEVEAVAVAEADLEEVIIETLLADLDLAGSVLEGVAHLLVLVIDDSRVELAPLDHLVDDVPNASLLRPPALALLRHLVRERPVLLLPCAQVLEGHQPVHQRDSQVTPAYQQLGALPIRWANTHILSDGVDAAVDPDVAGGEVVVDLFVWVEVGVL